ncbi:MAG TPA: hypothetical protein ENK52_01010, partial [Saprospiraceae bacterium]|nr:hypothetical protein [Saprospiraceae bacterium]
MANAISNIEKQFFFQKKAFTVFGILLLASLFISIASQQYYIAALPVVILLGFLAIVDFRKIFYLLIIFIPLSTEYVFPNGFGLDLPTEPLMLILMGIFFLFNIRHGKELKSDFFKHPLSLLLLLHVAWIFITAVTS